MQTIIIRILIFLLIASPAIAFDFPWGANPWQGASGTVTPTYDMTLAIVGDSTLTIETIDYTITGSPHTISGLSGLVAMDVTYGGTDDTTVFTGTDSGDVTGTSPSFSIDMDADKSLFCTFSSGSLINDPNVVGVYYFENDGTDESANANTLTNNNTATFVTTAPTPKQGTYSTKLLSSSTQFWSSASTDFDITGAITLGGWFYTGGTNGSFFTKHGASGEYGYILHNTSGVIEFAASTNGTDFTGASTTTAYVPVSDWVHVVFTYDGTNMFRLYIDGSEVTDGDFPFAYGSGGINNSSSDFMIGENGFTSDSWDGNIDEAFIFDRALTDAEILDIYTNGF